MRTINISQVASLQPTLTNTTTQVTNLETAVSPPTSTTLAYTAGVLTSMTEVVGGTNRVTTYSYTSNVLTQAAVAHNGVTKTTTYSYTAGILTSASTV